MVQVLLFSTGKVGRFARGKVVFSAKIHFPILFLTN